MPSNKSQKPVERELQIQKAIYTYNIGDFKLIDTAVAFFYVNRSTARRRLNGGLS
jgi:hypothetical protein